MSVDTGIIGLPRSGKTTVFNALTGGKADTYSPAPNVGITRVPEPRLAILAKMFNPKKVTPVEIRYIDIGAAPSVKATATARREFIGSQLLNEVSKVDTLLSVVRAFRDDTVPHVDGSIDVARDIANVDLELAFSDLAIIERRVERLNTSLKAAKPQERLVFAREQELLGKIKAGLEKDVPIRSMGLTPEEMRALSNYQFLSAKPLLTVVNIGEDDLPHAGELEKDSRPNSRTIALCGKLEMELAQLDPADAEKFRADMGIKESGLDRVVKASYELLGLITFFTVVSDELRAWSIPRGTPAVKAAGKIHTDMERGFIRAEAVGWADLMKCGSIAEARKKGMLRLEGKTYIVQDGDILTILFNV